MDGFPLETNSKNYQLSLGFSKSAFQENGEHIGGQLDGFFVGGVCFWMDDDGSSDTFGKRFLEGAERRGRIVLGRLDFQREFT